MVTWDPRRWGKHEPPFPSFEKGSLSGTLFKEFIYLDYANAVESLSAIQGGEVVEFVLSRSRDSEGGFGFGLKKVVDASLSGKKAKHLGEQVTLHQTQRSGVERLLKEVRDAGGKWEGELYFVPCRGTEDLEKNREHEWKPRARHWWQVLLGRQQADGFTPDKCAEMGIGREFVAVLVVRDKNEPEQVLLLRCDRSWLDCDAADVKDLCCLEPESRWWVGKATIVGKVAGTAGPGKAVSWYENGVNDGAVRLDLRKLGGSRTPFRTLTVQDSQLKAESAQSVAEEAGPQAIRATDEETTDSQPSNEREYVLKVSAPTQITVVEPIFIYR